MSVIVHGMEMPTTCTGCSFAECAWGSMICNAADKSIEDYFVSDEIPDWCPLEVYDE